MPDDTFDLTARLLGMIADLQGPSDDDWTGAPLDELALRLQRLRYIQGITHRIAQDVEDSIAATMETDAVITPAGRLIRQEKTTSTWRTGNSGEQMRDDLARVVASDIAVDVATGEIDQSKRNVALATMRAAYEAIPAFSGLKKAGRERFGLHIGDYRTYSTSYAIGIEELP